jgi:hypothetical protein
MRKQRRIVSLAKYNYPVAAVAHCGLAAESHKRTTIKKERNYFFIITYNFLPADGGGGEVSFCQRTQS